MSFNVGDFVYFTDTTTGSVHRGYIEKYQKGRDTRPAFINIAPRDYLVKFEKPLWKDSYDRAWCAAADLTLISKSPSTVTFSTSTTTTKPLSDKDNITVTLSSILNKSTVSQGNAGGNGSGSSGLPDYPWTPFYMTTDEFFDILKVAFEDTYGDKDNRPWHPEDLYINVSCVLEVVSNTLANAARLRGGKEPAGVKEI